MSNTSSIEKASGIITRINSDVQSGNTYYYFMLDTLSDIIFVSSSSISKELPLTQVGDQVSITFENYGNDSIDVLSFDNVLLNVN